MSAITDLINEIKNPGREFSPIPLWFLNDALTDGEIVRQLEDFNKKGVHGVVLHPRIGVPESIRYLSDEYMHYIKTAIETAARLDMKIVLYDEAMYPSGSAHGLVVKENPKFAAQGIFLSDDAGEGRLIAKTASGKFIVQGDTCGTIRGIHWGEDDCEPNAPRAGDLLSKESVDTFIRLTHERYYELFGKYFGNTVIGFFTDEPMALGRGARPNCFSWTWGFEDDFTAAGGDLSELEALFTGGTNKSVELYKRMIFERECNIYYKSLSDWCGEHNIALMGHPHRGDDIECERFFSIPGQDVVLRWLAPEIGGLDGHESAQGKCSSDSARIFGNRRNSNECFGACNKDGINWNFSGGDMKWYIDWLAVRGVNLFIPHAFYYSVEGKRRDERPPDVGPNNIWWEHFSQISTYIKRLSYIMTDSRNTARVCVMCENRNMHADEVRWLYQNQIEFNYVPYNYIPKGAYHDGRLHIRDNQYDYVYMDTKNLFPEMKQIHSILDIDHREIFTESPSPDLRATSVVKNGVKMWLLTNEGEDMIDTEAHLEGDGHVIKMDLWNGDVCRLKTLQEDKKAHFRLTLRRRESVLLLLGEDYFPPEKEKHYASVDFSLIREDKENFVKYYKGSLTGTGDDLYISVSAEEMVECYVNGFFCGVSLWNKHEFYLSPYLKKGVNIIELKVTGSARNRFTEHRAGYGLTN